MKEPSRLAAGASPHRITNGPTTAGIVVGSSGHNGRHHTPSGRKTAGTLALSTNHMTNPEGRRIGTPGKVSGSKLFARGAAVSSRFSSVDVHTPVPCGGGRFSGAASHGHNPSQGVAC